MLFILKDTLRKYNIKYIEKIQYKMKRLNFMYILEMDSGDNCTIKWTYLMPLNCTPKNGLNGKLYV